MGPYQPCWHIPEERNDSSPAPEHDMTFAQLAPRANKKGGEKLGSGQCLEIRRLGGASWLLLQLGKMDALATLDLYFPVATITWVWEAGSGPPLRQAALFFICIIHWNPMLWFLCCGLIEYKATYMKKNKIFEVLWNVWSAITNQVIFYYKGIY